MLLLFANVYVSKSCLVMQLITEKNVNLFAYYI